MQRRCSFIGKLQELGKVHPGFFDEVIFPQLGAARSDVLVKPQHGVDFGAIELPDDKVMVMSADPFFIQPSLGWERAAWFAVHIMASDVAVSGIKPTHMAIDLNLPPDIDEETLKIVWNTTHEECRKLGISIVTGHTGRYAGCNYPMVGGATMFGIGDKKDLIAPGMMKPGDKIIVSKGPAIETTGLMAVQFPEFLGDFAEEAKRVFYQMSAVKDALTAAEVRGVTRMHDATEFGVYGGIVEMANVSGLGMKVHKDEIVMQDVVRKTCDVFGIDPYIAISEGTLLATVRPESAEKILRALEKVDIPASVVGEVLESTGEMILVDDGNEKELKHPGYDPFWVTFEKYLKKQRGERE
jgi:hydrogenase expression/formation protein HypE